VFLIKAMHGILPKDDPEAAEVVKRAMVRDGLHIMCCGKDLQINRAEGGKRPATSVRHTSSRMPPMPPRASSCRTRCSTAASGPARSLFRGARTRIPRLRGSGRSTDRR